MSSFYSNRSIHVEGYLYMLLLIGKNWKQHKCLLTVEWLNNLRYINTIKYYGAVLKKNDIYIQSLHIYFHLHYTLVEFKNKLKSKYGMIPFL